MSGFERQLLSGNEAVALAALDGGVSLGTGYPGTPSTEILEEFGVLGGRAQWAPNEKVALEVGLGAAFASARALVTMKHVGLNVAADTLFTATYTGVSGALVVVSADDPGMASSQNEQDNRHYARAAGVPMLEPADSQEAYDFTLAALDLSHRFELPVMLRMTTRVCHSRSAVVPRSQRLAPPAPSFERNIEQRVMIPQFAQAAHRRLRDKLARIEAWNEGAELNREWDGSSSLGIVSSGLTSVLVREAEPDARLLKIAVTHPLPIDRIREFASGVDRCVVVEEGDPYLLESIRAAGVPVEGKLPRYRFGELNVGRVARLLAGDDSPESPPARATPPTLCKGCPHRPVFRLLRELDCIVSGDIGCYTLGVQPPFRAIDSTVCMGASIGVGLGLRHVLPDHDARRVVSVIGDSTFVHSGIGGLVEMIYNPPTRGHVLLILDNDTTAMTGLQDHPGTGKTLSRQATGRVVYEDLARSLGVADVQVIDPVDEEPALRRALERALEAEELSVIVTRRPCVLRRREGRPSARIHAHDVAAPTGSFIGVTSAAFVGLGGQGVISASDILAEVAFALGNEVKTAEVHGMSQRGGSVTSDVRFGRDVLSPVIPTGRADYVVVLDDAERDAGRRLLAPDGELIVPSDVDVNELHSRRSLNMALLGVLSTRLAVPAELFRRAIRARFPDKLHRRNLEAFSSGRQSAARKPQPRRRVAAARKVARSR